MKKPLLLICSCFACFWASAQTTDSVSVATAAVLPVSSEVKTDPAQASGKPVFRKNNVKMNLSSLALGNYNFSYERSLSRKISFMAGYRFMPASPASELPLVQKLLSDDPDLNNLHASNNTLTGEFRFYGGNKPGARGFYLSLYGRYTSMQADYLTDYESYTYDQYGYSVDEKIYQLPLKSNLKGLGGGLMIGAQWLIAKRVVLDWYILGGHYGKLTGNADAAVDLSDMTAAEKAELQQELESFEVVGVGLISEATVTDEGVKTIVDGPFLGLRGAGISLGIAF